MSEAENTFQRLLPTFIIPVGSHVVLRNDHTLLQGAGKKPRGTVGIVAESPADNRYAYTIQFSDGTAIKAHFGDLALRRREVEELLVLQDTDLRSYIVYRCQVGSHAFGLSDENSDNDIRGIYLPPARLHWSLFKLPEQLEFADDSCDEVYWEMEKFLRLALKGNPNVLETLWTPLVIQSGEVADRLRSIRQAFLSRHLYKTYSGYVLSQFRRMANAQDKHGTYRPKHAMHLIRLLYSGIEALRTGDIRIDVGEHRQALLAIKAGDWSFEQAKRRALELDGEFQSAFAETNLPEQPNYTVVNEFLLWARRRMIDA